MNVAQPNGYDGAKTAASALNHAQCASNGYMQDSGDWRNVEMQGYIKINSVMSGAGNCEAVWYARGGRHIDPQPNCQGSSMKAFLADSGATRFAKEQYHIAYNYTAVTNQINTSLIGKWIGFKYIVYNKKVGTTSLVKQEIFVDIDNTNTWVKVDERSDTNGWGAQGLQCKGNTEDFQISFGGPLAGFRIDNAQSIDFKWLSVREINGDAIAIQPPDAQPPGSCGS